MALIAWDLPIGSLLSVALTGLVFVALGIWHRRRVATVLGSTAIAIVGLVFLIDTSGWSSIHSGILTFNVTVRDEESGLPVADAAVFVEYHFRTYRTDLNGNVTFTADLQGCRSPSLLGIMRRNDMSITRFWVYAGCDGYDYGKVNLAQALGKNRWPMRRKNLPPIIIEIAKKDDIAGAGQ